MGRYQTFGAFQKSNFHYVVCFHEQIHMKTKPKMRNFIASQLVNLNFQYRYIIINIFHIGTMTP